MCYPIVFSNHRKLQITITVQELLLFVYLCALYAVSLQTVVFAA